MEESVAEENHLKPLIFHGPNSEDGCGEYVAIVSVPETSLPPLLSVIHCPLVQAYWDFLDVNRSYAFLKTALVAGSRAFDAR